jgi:hypothetical protein
MEAMARVVSIFFQGVARLWRYAWNESPWTSRLVHGVGITSMGRLMDVIMNEVNSECRRAVALVARRLRKIEKRCTEGSWPAPLSCPWDALSQDKRKLAEAASLSQRCHFR